MQTPEVTQRVNEVATFIGTKIKESDSMYILQITSPRSILFMEWERVDRILEESR